MRIPLDECVPRRLKRDLPFPVETVPEIGCAGLVNGKLLQVASHSFDVFITLDQNLQYQQNLASCRFRPLTLPIGRKRCGKRTDDSAESATPGSAGASPSNRTR